MYYREVIINKGIIYILLAGILLLGRHNVFSAQHEGDKIVTVFQTQISKASIECYNRINALLLNLRGDNGFSDSNSCESERNSAPIMDQVSREDYYVLENLGLILSSLRPELSNIIEIQTLEPEALKETVCQIQIKSQQLKKVLPQTQEIIKNNHSEKGNSILKDLEYINQIIHLLLNAINGLMVHMEK